MARYVALILVCTGITSISGLFLFNCTQEENIGSPIPVPDQKNKEKDCDMIETLAFSPDYTLMLTGNYDNNAYLWDLANRKILQVFSGHKDSVVSVAFSYDGKKVLTGGADGKAILWDAYSGKKLATLHMEEYDEKVTAVAFSPDNSRLFTGSGGHVIFWNASTGSEIDTFANGSYTHFWEVTSIICSPDGKTLLVGGSKSINEIKTFGGVISRTFDGHDQEILCMAISQDRKRILTGSLDETAILWDAETGDILRKFSGIMAPVISVAFSSDRLKVVTGDRENKIKLWDVLTGEEERMFSGRYGGYVIYVAISPDDSKILSFTQDQKILIWDVATGASTLFFDGRKKEFCYVGEAKTDGGKPTVWDLSQRLFDFSSKMFPNFDEKPRQKNNTDH